MNPPTTRCLLENDLLRVEIDQEVGASITDLAIRGARGQWWPMLRRSQGIVTCGEETACYLLAPWSNRIRDGVFWFEGKRVQVRTNWPDGTAIHGDVRDRPWKILDRSPVSARLRFDSRDHLEANWPWMFTAEVRYELVGDGFAAELKIVNEDDSRMPVGGGFHPFFNRVLWDVADDPVVQGDVTGRYPCEKVMVVGEARMERVAEGLKKGTVLHEALDDIFECGGARASIRWPASGVEARFECSEEFGKLVVYSPMHENGSPLPFFCVEPVSMVNDGFNVMGKVKTHGVQVLEGGEGMRMGWGVKIAIADGRQQTADS